MIIIIIILSKNLYVIGDVLQNGDTCLLPEQND